MCLQDSIISFIEMLIAILFDNSYNIKMATMILEKVYPKWRLLCHLVYPRAPRYDHSVVTKGISLKKGKVLC